MAAFDRVKSGIPEMDEALDNIRLGDNVVWRVSELSQFKLFRRSKIGETSFISDLPVMNRFWKIALRSRE